MDAYDRMIAEAAERLVAAMKLAGRTGGECPSVWAIPTTYDTDGKIHIGTDPVFAPLVRPSDNRASAFSRWDAVPYAAVYGILWQACRCQPIMPRKEA